MQRGVLYLVTIMDWFSRKVLVWQLSNSVDAVLCVEALKETLAKYGAPEIHYTDEGSLVTSGDWTDVLTDVKLKISRDGKGGWIKNCIIERLWRSLKQEAVYLHEITDGFQAKWVIDTWIRFYNSERPHTALDKRTPDIAYFGQVETRKEA